MQQELGLAEIRILGVNSVGSEAGNDATCNGRDIPWLQDTAQEHVWSQWQVTYRDVVILDENNVPVDVYNLSPPNDLAIQANYDELKNRLLAAR